MLVPPLQTPLFGTFGAPPRQIGQGWMPATSGRLSPTRKISELSGRSMFVAPVAQSSVPDAGAATLLMTQVLVGVLLGFGIGSGPPKKQPMSEQSRSLPVSASVAAVRVAVWPVQLATLVMDEVKSGVIAGSGTEFCPPPK